MGAHLNVVGASQSFAREVDSATMAASSLFVDRRESTLNESGDYLFALREGAIGPDHIQAEIGEVLDRGEAGADQSRRDYAVQITGVGDRRSGCGRICVSTGEIQRDRHLGGILNRYLLALDFRPP